MEIPIEILQKCTPEQIMDSVSDKKVRPQLIEKYKQFAKSQKMSDIEIDMALNNPEIIKMFDNYISNLQKMTKFYIDIYQSNKSK